MISYIYLIKDCWNNKIYIGQHTSNKQNYFGSGKIIKSIIKKRKHLLEKRILGFCETKEELDEAEKECIEFFDARNPIYGYNIAKGGEGGALFFGKQHNLITKQKMSQSKLGKKRSNEIKNKIAKSHKGLKLTNATKLKISQSNKGKILSSQTKQKMSKAKIGFCHSNDTKIKMKNSHLRNDLNNLIIKELKLSGLTYNQIAKKFNCSISTVFKRINYASF